MRKDPRIRIYPEYLDATLTRAQGRRLPQKYAVEKPSLLELKIAAQKLGLEPEVDQEKAYSRRWFEPRGLVYLRHPDPESRVPKTQLLRSLGETVRDYARPRLLAKQKELVEKRKQKPKPTAASVKKTTGPQRGKRPRGRR